MLKHLLTSDKAPFVLSIALSVLGWLVTTSIGNLANVIVLGVWAEQHGGLLHVTVRNSSVNRTFVDGVVRLTCLSGDCLAPIAAGGSFVQPQEHPPYLIQGNRICSFSSRDIAAVATLPPSARITYTVRPVTGADPPVFGFSGNLKDQELRCPDSGSRLVPENVMIIEGPSLTLFLLEYYNHLLVLSMGIVVLFLIWIVSRSAAGEKTETDTDEKTPAPQV